MRPKSPDYAMKSCIRAEGHSHRPEWAWAQVAVLLGAPWGVGTGSCPSGGCPWGLGPGCCPTGGPPGASAQVAVLLRAASRNLQRPEEELLTGFATGHLRRKGAVLFNVGCCAWDWGQCPFPTSLASGLVEATGSRSRCRRGHSLVRRKTADQGGTGDLLGGCHHPFPEAGLLPTEPQLPRCETGGLDG